MCVGVYMYVPSLRNMLLSMVLDVVVLYVVGYLTASKRKVLFKVSISKQCNRWCLPCVIPPKPITNHLMTYCNI